MWLDRLYTSHETVYNILSHIIWWLNTISALCRLQYTFYSVGLALLHPKKQEWSVDILLDILYVTNLSLKSILSMLRLNALVVIKAKVTECEQTSYLALNMFSASPAVYINSCPVCEWYSTKVYILRVSLSVL